VPDIKIFNPDGIYRPKSPYMQVTRARGSDFAFIAGQVPVDTISILNLSPSAKYASLAAKTVDAIVGSTVEEPAIQNAAQKTGSNVKRFRFSDYGVDYYSIGLIAGDEMLAARADLLKRLVGATMQGYAW
jgi:ABC-type nitrate/sulfonate/bicarbonate transport system substrate-binding protein